MAIRHFRKLTDEQKERISQYSDQSAEVQGDEYFAAIAETMIDERGNIKEPSLFRKFVATIRNFFRDILGISLSDNDIRYMLWKSANNLKRNSNKATQLNDVITEMRFSTESKNNSDARFAIGKPYDRKEYPRGYAEPNLATTDVNIVSIPKHNFSGSAKEATQQARDWAKENIVRTYTDEETGGKGRIRISANSIHECLNPNTLTKSANINAHISALTKLPEIIRESVDCESHPDFKKGEDGTRRPENGTASDNIIHRLFGAVEIDGKTYRVKTTIKEIADEATDNTSYTYELTEIELLDDSAVTSQDSDADRPLSRPNNSISLAKLLDGIEMSYMPGAEILKMSEYMSRNNEDARLYYAQSAFVSALKKAGYQIKSTDLSDKTNPRHSSYGTSAYISVATQDGNYRKIRLSTHTTGYFRAQHEFQLTGVHQFDFDEEQVKLAVEVFGLWMKMQDIERRNSSVQDNVDHLTGEFNDAKNDLADANSHWRIAEQMLQSGEYGFNFKYEDEISDGNKDEAYRTITEIGEGVKERGAEYITQWKDIAKKRESKYDEKKRELDEAKAELAEAKKKQSTLNRLKRKYKDSPRIRFRVNGDNDFSIDLGGQPAEQNGTDVRSVAADLQQQFGVEVEVIDSPDSIPNAQHAKP